MAIRAIIPSNSNTAEPSKPYDPLQFHLSGLKTLFSKSNIITICPADHSIMRGSPTTVTIQYDSEMCKVATTIFQELQKAARAGKCMADLLISIHHDSSDRARIKTVLSYFGENIPIRYDVINGSSPNTHSTYCELKERSFTLSVKWDHNNKFLDPRPEIKFARPLPWGTELLDVNRKKGVETDCTLIMGEGHEFPAHRVIFANFSPYFKAMASNGMTASTSGRFPFPETKSIPRDALNAFVSFMYAQKIDLESFPIQVAIEFLNWSYQILSEPLRIAAFDSIYARSEVLTDLHVLHLLFIHSVHPEFVDTNKSSLKVFCEWLLRTKPNFYKTVFKIANIAAEDLLMSFTVSKHYGLDDMKNELDKIWSDMSTEQKTSFVRASVESEHLSLLKTMDKLCKRACKTLDDKDPHKKDFLEAYAVIYKRAFELRTKTPGLINLKTEENGLREES